MVIQFAPVGCPGPPDWYVISAKSKEVSGPANRAIEMAYRQAHSDHWDAILVGSQWDDVKGSTDILLPKGAPNKKFGNALLRELRGEVQQLRPDIIDFELRVFYEIKSARHVNENLNNAVGAETQLADYYKKAELIRRQYDERPWSNLLASWKPRTVLSFSDDPHRIVCTAATNYSIWPHGLILYDVREYTKKEKDTKKAPKRVVVSAFDTDFSSLMPGKKALMKALREFQPLQGDFVIVAPIRFHQDWKTYIHQQKMKKTLELMAVDVPPFLNVRHPVGLFRISGWIGIGIPVVAFTIPMAAMYAGEAAAAGALAAAAGGAAEGVGGAEIISLAAYRAALAKVASSPTAKALAGAAGVLVVTVYTKSADAAPSKQGGWTADAKQTSTSDEIKMRDIAAIRLVPIEAFKPYEGVQAASSVNNVPGDFVHSRETMREFKLNTSVYYDWKKHIVIGRLTVEYE